MFSVNIVSWVKDWIEFWAACIMERINASAMTFQKGVGVHDRETITAVVFFAQYKSDRHFISTFLGVYFPLLLPCSFEEANTSFKLSAEAGITVCVITMH